MSESMSVTKGSPAGSAKLLWVVLLAVTVAALANVIFYNIVIEIFRIPMMFISETNTAEPELPILGKIGWLLRHWERFLFSVSSGCL
ncbi:MAG: hypothetical protein GWO26_27060 [Phycisphaerae bacterium]|nr:hypothetical protein [Phycisphaerae bacterium]